MLNFYSFRESLILSGNLLFSQGENKQYIFRVRVSIYLVLIVSHRGSTAKRLGAAGFWGLNDINH